MEPLPLSQAPTNGIHFLGLLGLDNSDGTPRYREWRETYRDFDGILRVATPRGASTLSEAYGCGIVAMGFMPLPPKGID